MRKSLLAGLCLALCVNAAQGGEVKRTAPQASLHQIQRLASWRRSAFHTADANSGAVNANATVVKLRRGELSVAVCIDTKSEDGKVPDVVRIDLTGKGQFDGAATVPLKNTSSPNTFMATFSGKIRTRHGDSNVPVWVQGEYRKYNKNHRYASVKLLTAAECSCRFGAKTFPVRILDGDTNLKLGDSWKSSGLLRRAGRLEFGDWVFIDTDDNDRAGFMSRTTTVATPYGQPVKIDGKWYDITLSEDGGSMTAKSVKIKTGKLVVPHKKWNGMLASSDWLVIENHGDDTPIEVKVGKYKVARFMQYAPSGSGSGRMSRMGFHRVAQGGEAAVVKEGRTTKMKIGPPLVARVRPKVMTIRGKGQWVRFSLEVTDVGGRELQVLSVEGGRRPTPKLSIVNADGREVHSVSMRYG